MCQTLLTFLWNATTKLGGSYAATVNITHGTVCNNFILTAKLPKMSDFYLITCFSVTNKFRNHEAWHGGKKFTFIFKIQLKRTRPYALWTELKKQKSSAQGRTHRAETVVLVEWLTLDKILFKIWLFNNVKHIEIRISGNIFSFYILMLAYAIYHVRAVFNCWDVYNLKYFFFLYFEALLSEYLCISWT